MSNDMKTPRRDESNEVAQELDLTQLSRRALVSGIPLGFNGAEVVHFIDTETMADLIEITWGDQQILRLPRMRTPQSWAISYAEDERCMRAPRTLVVPRQVLSEPSKELDKRFTEALLELMP